MSQPSQPSVAIRRGFTLTELAIVLGIIGLILGAIWTAASKVYSNNRVNKAAQEILTVANGIRSLYGPKNAVDAGDLTGLAMNNNLFPADMIQACGAAGASMDGLNPCPVHPWGGEMTVGSQTGWGGFVDSPTTFEILLSTYGTNSSTSYCSALMAMVIGQGANAGLIAAFSNGSAQGGFLVTSSTQLNDPNIINCSGNIAFQFSL